MGKEHKRGDNVDKVIQSFMDAKNIDEVKASVENAVDRMYVSWASVDVKDHDNEIIPIEDIIKDQDTLLERGGPISDEHSNRIIGRTMAYTVMVHPTSGTEGVLHLNKIFADNDLDDKVWSEIKSGERTGSSVGGYNQSVSFTKDPMTGQPIKQLDGFRQFETASVRSPCNPLALNEAVSAIAKSKAYSGDDDDKKKAGIETDPNKQDDINAIAGLEEKSSVKKPFSGFESFTDCVSQMRSDGKSEESANKICGSLQAREEKKMRTKTEVKGILNDMISKINNVLEKKDELADIDLGLDGPAQPDPKEDVGSANTSKKENNINDRNNKKGNQQLKGDNMDEELKKSLSEFGDILKKLDARVRSIEKRNLPEDEEEEEKKKKKNKTAKQEEEDEEETEQAKGEHEPENEDKDEDEDEEEEKKKGSIKKDEAASDIEGEAGSEAPESPEPEAPNDEDAFKSKLAEAIKAERPAIIAEVRKQLTTKSTTPRMGSKDMLGIKKSAQVPQDFAIDIALGKKNVKREILAVNKMMRPYDKFLGGDGR